MAETSDIGDRESADASGKPTTLVGTEAPPRGAAQQLGDWVSENIAALPAALAVLGALSYGALNVAATMFYEPLGVTPSEVGLGYGELLGRVAVVIAVLGVTAFAGIVLVSVVVHRLLERIGKPRPVLTVRQTLVVVLGGLVVLMAYDLVLSVPPPISLHWSWADVAGMVTFSILVTLGVLAGLVLFAAHLADRCRLTRRHVVFVAVVFAFAVPAAFVAHALTGLHEVKLGHRQRASLFGAPFPWQVTVAYVTWKTPLPGIPRRSGCLLYLGSSGNTVQLYDPNPRARRTIRFPAPDVIVEFQPERTSC